MIIYFNRANSLESYYLSVQEERAHGPLLREGVLLGAELLREGGLLLLLFLCEQLLAVFSQ